MKNYKILLLILLSFVISCKRGEEDPALSLLSRTNRISNDWLVKLQITNNTYQIADIVNGVEKNSKKSSSLQKFENENYAYQFISNDSNLANQKPDSIVKGDVIVNRMSIYKDGTFNSEQAYSYEYDSVSNNTKYINEVENRIIISGNWAFLYGNKPDRKNKEEVQFDIRTKKITTTKSIRLVTTIFPLNEIVENNDNTYQANENSFIWQLIGLRGSRIHAQIVNSPTVTYKLLNQSNIDTVNYINQKIVSKSITDIYLAE